MSVIAPFYVAAGFGLYLTRRSQLEAWDIELGFRNLAKRLQKRRMVATGCVCLLTGFASLMLPNQPLQAAELNREEARVLIRSVMQDDDFGQRETHTAWKYVGQAEVDDIEDPHWLLEWVIDLVKGFTQGFARVAEWLIWLALGGLIVYLVSWLLRNRFLLERFTPNTPRQRQIPAVMLGLDIRPESLPEDIPVEALNLLGQGAHRSALSLLYRGSLSMLVHQYQLKIPDSATEGECLDLAREALGQQGFAYLVALTQSWRKLAYGHHRPDLQATEQLCHGWKQAYGE